MKDTLLVPVRYVFRGILFFAVIGIVAAFHRHALSAGRVKILESFFLTVLADGPGIGFFSLFFALLVSHFSIIRRPGLKTLSLVLLLATATVSLYFGLHGLSVLRGGARTGAALPGSPPPAERLRKTAEAYLWVGDTKSTPLRTILLLEPGKGSAGFKLYPEGVYNAEKETLRILQTGRELSLSPGNGEETPKFLAPLFRDVAYAASIATPGTLFDPKSGIFVLAFVFFGFSLWTLARISRWPLFNMWIVFGVAWLTLMGVRFVGTVLAPELARLGPIAAFLPALFPVTFGLVFFLGGLLLPPLKAWKRDLRYD